MGAASARVTVRRLPDRARYERSTIEAILDEALFCHLGFVVDGQPYVIPTIHARRGDRIYVHGSSASRMLRIAGTGVPVCVTATILDGLVLARSVFNHSMNYRSVVVLGTAREVTDRDEKRVALRTIVEHVMPGRWEQSRHPTQKELKATTVLAVPLEEASAKVRTGPPHDTEDDLELPVWAGEIPVALTTLAPRRDPLQSTTIEPSFDLWRFVDGDGRRPRSR